MVPSRNTFTHQSFGPKGSVSGAAGLSSQDPGILHSSKNRQYHNNVLPWQTRGHQASHSIRTGPGDLEVANSSPHNITDRACSGRGQRLSRYSKQNQFPMSRMGTKRAPAETGLRIMAHSKTGSFCDRKQQEVRKVRQQVSSEELLGERSTDAVDRDIRLCVPAISPHPKSGEQDEERTMPSHSHYSGMAETVLVHGITPVLDISTHSLPSAAKPTLNEQQSNCSSSNKVSKFVSLEPHDYEFTDLNITRDCRSILQRSRAPSTNRSYVAKWKRFCHWCKGKELHPYEPRNRFCLTSLS